MRRQQENATRRHRDGKAAILALDREMTKTATYDSAEFLDTPEALQFYLEEAMESGDSSLIAHAIGVAARAKGMSDVARSSRRSRESLYRSLSSSGKPEFGTVIDSAQGAWSSAVSPSRHGQAAKGARRKRKAA